MIPKPFPFMRIGLANLPLILALDLLSPGAFVLLVLIKVLGQALISGTLFSYVFLFSLSGTLASAAVMRLLRRSLGGNRISFVGVGVAGALSSNGIQMILAGFFVFGRSVQYIAPPFLAAGVLTGTILGLFCEAFTSRSVWYSRAVGRDAGSGKKEDKTPHGDAGTAAGTHPGTGDTRFFQSGDLFIAALFMSAAFLCNPSTVLRLVQFVLFWLFAALSGKKGRPLITLLVILGITAFNLLAPYGRVLAEFGIFRITRGALLSGLHKALTLEGLFMLSRWAVRPDLRLPGPLGELMEESFRILRRITESRGLISRKNFIGSVDALMVALSEEAEESPAGPSPAPRLPGRLVLAAAVLGVTAISAAGYVFPAVFF
jgi:heptaprenyl diphosphate synthase